MYKFDIFACHIFQVGVHIADVTHFIKPGTNLDDEAFKRGTTVYLADKVTSPTTTKSTYYYLIAGGGGGNYHICWYGMCNFGGYLFRRK